MEKNISEQVADLFEQVRKYINLKADYLKLSLGERLIKFFSFFMLHSLIIYIVFFVMFFLGMAFSIWFGEVTDRPYLGFLLTAIVFILLGVIVYLLRKPLIVDPLTRAYLKLTGTGDQKEEEDEK